MREHAGDDALGRTVVLAGTADFNRQGVLVPGCHVGRDLERVGREVSFGHTQILRIEPNVGVVEDAIEHEKPPAGRGVRRSERLETELAAVEHGPIGGRELGCGSPVTGHGERRPVAVVKIEIGETLVQITVGDVRAPRTREIE